MDILKFCPPFQNKKNLKKLSNNTEYNAYKYSDILMDETKLAKKIKKGEYLETGKYPIVDQGKGLIGGYTNDNDNFEIYNNIPCIIFGDHTRELKYIDFPCFIGADGVKIINSKKYLREKIDIKYLYYYMLNNEIPNDGYSRHFKYIKQLIYIFPSLQTQKKIVEILDKSQSLIDKRKEQIKLYDDLIQATFYNMFGDPVKNEKGWEVLELQTITTDIRSGNTPKGGNKVYVDEGILFLRSKNVWRNKILLEDIVYISPEIHKKMKNTSIKNKDILITKTGRFNTENSSLGRAALYLGEDNKTNINGHVYLVRLDENKANHKFILYILISKEYRDYIRRICVGGIDKRQINKDHLEEFPIIYPPIELQNKFAEKVEAIEKEKYKLENSLKELENNYNALVQKIFK